MRAKSWMIICAAAGLAMSAQAGLTHRYVFDNDVTDAVGTKDGGAVSAAYVVDAPAGANGPANSLSVGTVAPSGFTLPSATLSAAAGSISVWVKADALANGPYVIGGTQGVRLKTVTTGYRALYKTGGVLNTTLGTGTASVGAWTHLVITWNNTGARTFYANGVQKGTKSDGDAILPAKAVQIGNLTLGTAKNQFDGSLYDLRIYDHELALADVAKLHTNPGDLPPAGGAFPALADYIEGSALISNGDFDQASNLAGPGHVSSNYNINGTFGDFGNYQGNTADVPGWTPYYDDPNGLTTNIGTAHQDDSDLVPVPVLDGTFYLDTTIDVDDARIFLNSVMDYRNGLIQSNVLDGVTVSSNNIYKFSVNATGHNDVDASTFTATLTDGTGSPITNSTLTGTLDTWIGTQTKEVSGADLLGIGQVNVTVDQICTNDIPGYPDGTVNPTDGDIVGQVRLYSVSLLELIAPEEGDLNRDGVVSLLDVDLANSYLDGSIDGGPDAATRQETMTLEELNLTEFDFDNDGVFDADDVALLEAQVSPIIDRAAMNGSGHFEVEISRLDIGREYFLVKNNNLTFGSFTEVADHVVAASATETLTDTNITDTAFFKVTY